MTKPTNQASGDRTLSVCVGPASYEIRVCAEPFDGLTALLADLGGARALLVSDENVAPLYADAAASACRELGREVAEVRLPAGEGTKSYGQLEALLERGIAAEIGRDDVVLALGGGVVGDVAALAASLLRRGVPLVQLPTSLVAQVDSAVGGKTAINSPQGKNLVGTFQQPAGVVAATRCLETLPEREFRSGLGEVVKYALLDGEPFLALLEQERARIMARDPALLTEVVARCLAQKVALVQRDERDTGERRRLNLGHTLGHALEAAAGYGELRHGEAVAVGLVGALALSRAWVGLEPGVLERVRRLLGALGLESRAPTVQRRAIERALLQDKKREGAGISWVVLRAVGEPDLHACPAGALSQALETLVEVGVISG